MLPGYKTRFYASLEIMSHNDYWFIALNSQNNSAIRSEFIIKKKNKNIIQVYIRLREKIKSLLDELLLLSAEEEDSLHREDTGLFVKLVDEESKITGRLQRLAGLEKKFLDKYNFLNPVFFRDDAKNEASDNNNNAADNESADQITLRDDEYNTIKILIQSAEQLRINILKKKEEMEPDVKENYTRLRNDYLRANIKRQLGEFENST